MELSAHVNRPFLNTINKHKHIDTWRYDAVITPAVTSCHRSRYFLLTLPENKTLGLFIQISFSELNSDTFHYFYIFVIKCWNTKYIIFGCTRVCPHFSGERPEQYGSVALSLEDQLWHKINLYWSPRGDSLVYKGWLIRTLLEVLKYLLSIIIINYVYND